MQLARLLGPVAFALCGQLVPLQAQRPATLRLVRTVTGDQLGMGHIGAITVDAQGRILALETSPDARGIVVLDSTGKIITRIGRPGQGPGEFEGVTHTLAWMGDTLLTFDQRAARLTGFDRAGKPVLIHDWPRTTPMPVRILTARGGPLGVYVGVVSLGTPTVVQRGQPPPIIERKNALKILRINRDGSGTVIPAIADTTLGVVSTQCTSMKSGDRPQVYLPFKDPAPLVAATPTGQLLRGHLDKYQIDVVDVVSGRTLRSIRRDVSDRALTAADLSRTPEGARLLAAERESGGRLAGDAARSRPCAIYDLFPKSGPPLRSVTADDSGRVWVEAMDPVRAGALVLHVYDATGNLTVETTMPERDMRVAPYVLGDRLYLVHADDLGVQSISVYRLVR